MEEKKFAKADDIMQEMNHIITTMQMFTRKPPETQEGIDAALSLLGRFIPEQAHSQMCLLKIRSLNLFAIDKLKVALRTYDTSLLEDDYDEQKAQQELIKAVLGINREHLV